MDVRRIAGQQYPSIAVRRRLPRHVGEARNPRGAVDAVVGAVNGLQRLTELAQRGLATVSHLPLSDQDPHSTCVELAERVNAERVAMDAPLCRRLGELGFGDQVADGR